MPLTPHEIRRLHDEAKRDRQEKLRNMTPLERMELAFRLSRLMLGDR